MIEILRLLYTRAHYGLLVRIYPLKRPKGIEKRPLALQRVGFALNYKSRLNRAASTSLL